MANELNSRRQQVRKENRIPYTFHNQVVRVGQDEESVGNKIVVIVLASDPVMDIVPKFDEWFDR